MVTSKEYLRQEVQRVPRQFAGGSWAARLEELKDCLLRLDPSTYREWDVIKRTMLVTDSAEIMDTQAQLCADVKNTNVFEFGAGVLGRLHWASNKYFVYDLPSMVALQRYICARDPVSPIFSSNIATFLDLMRDNSGCATSFFAAWSLSECPTSIREIVLSCAAENCDFIFLAYQPVFDFIDNTKYFRGFAEEHKEFKWEETSASPVEGFYLTGRRDRWS